MEQIIKKDPLTGEEFVAKKSSQRFATAANRIKFNNKQASILNQERAFFDKPCKKGELVLRTLYNPKSDNIFHKEYLLGKELQFDAYNHIAVMKNEKFFAYYGYAIRKIPNSNNYQILKL